MKKEFITQNVQQICKDGLSAFNQWEGDALSYLKADPRKNRASVWCIENGNGIIRNNKEIVRIAVAQDGWALQFASEGLRKDKEIVSIVVAQNGRTLQFASEGLRKDKEIVSIAVAQNGWALKYASDRLKNDLSK